MIFLQFLVEFQISLQKGVKTKQEIKFRSLDLQKRPQEVLNQSNPVLGAMAGRGSSAPAMFR